MRLFAIALIFVGVVACEEAPELALGPPRCEPARELDHERNLKDGFRALYEGDLERAKARFSAVEAEEPGHPEAVLGQRLAGRGQVVPPSKVGHAERRGREVLVAGLRLEVPLEVVTDGLRFEALAELNAARGLTRESFAPRSRSGRVVDPKQMDEVRAAVELIVLHDTGSVTRAERVATLDERGASVHFIVDWDGGVHQLLDLGFAARHLGDAGLDARSIGIELVNPVDLARPGALPDGTERPRSPRLAVPGQEVEQWGYTEAQLASLERLVDALLGLFPQVARRLPESAAGVVPRAVPGREVDVSSGVFGHLHLSKEAADPGAAFPWDRLKKALGR